MKAQYGEKLRDLVINKFSIENIFDIEKAEAFERKVAAYPAITLISNKKKSVINYQKSDTLDELLSNKNDCDQIIQKKLDSSSWTFGNNSLRNLIEKLNKVPLITESCRIGIGVASGADKIFIGDLKNKIENECILPIVKSMHIKNGKIEWANEYIINPYTVDGDMKPLQNYPKLRSYLLDNEIKIRNRNCAKKNPNFWYKTIDRINEELTFKRKILIPDIKCDSSSIVVENGAFYPHHNLYWIIPDDWDIDCLAYVLKNGLAALYVKAFSNKLGGGYFRFQAQYLKMIRLPRWGDLNEMTKKLISSNLNCDDNLINCEIYMRLFNLKKNEAEMLLRMK